jgi:glycosyltransferase involved in cell wall biosynthesis
MYHWNTNRVDWLLGTTLHAPTRPADDAPVVTYDGIPTHQLILPPESRAALRSWVHLYRVLQSQAIDHISAAILREMEAHIAALMPAPPTIVHNVRVGREGLTFAAQKFARRRDIPFVLTTNHHHTWRGWFYRDYLRAYRAADAVIAHTEYERRELARLGVDETRLHVLGVGPILAPTADGADFRARMGIAPDAPLLLYLGQKYAYKRFDLLARAMETVWAKVPNAVALFIGPRTPYSRQFFARLHDPRIIEIDIVDLQTKTNALAACDVLVMPSAKESFGGVYVEAWTLGKPVIGGDAPALSEIIREGESGFTVGADADLLAARLLTLIGDPALREAMGRAGQAFARQYTWDRLGAQLKAIYDRVRGSSA